ncbi:prepilin peptidase [Leifsonia sp. NPDC058194]|uniref:prepilin peptidase n=1 Tax=Leifsonia sp. NPDC058194 TaxID=3346374 RepID=UPI0036DD962E
MTGSVVTGAASTTMILAASLACFGVLIGSFLNVVVYRVPLGLSVARPPSSCPTCGTEIKRRDNVPIVSWLLLRGRCRHCRSAISARYPMVELGTGVFFLAVAIASLAPILRATTPAAIVGGILSLSAYLYLAAISVALALIDIDTHRLPNAIVLPSYLVGLVLLSSSALISGQPAVLVPTAAGLAIAFVVYFVLWLVYPRGMGFGDVKLAGVLGMYLGFAGWPAIIVGLFAAFVLGGAFAIGLVVLRKVDQGSGIAFGPWMLAGAWVGIFIGGPLWSGYMSLIGFVQ